MSKETKDSSIDTELETPESEKEESKKEEEKVEDNSELEELKAKLEECEDKYLRVHASFENSKRLLAKDKASAVAYANETFAGDLLSVIDSLDSAIAMIAELEDDTNSEFIAKVKEGLRLTDNQLHKVLEKHQIKPIECDKEFDPNLHQAIMQVESDEHNSGEIVQVMQKGYTIKDRVLRPAMVSTAK